MKSDADRVDAARLRKRKASGEPMTVDQAARLDHYEKTAKPTNGRSASESREIIHVERESRAAAEGDHPHPEAYAAVARAEGLRADTLLRIVTEKLLECNDQYLILFKHLLKRSTMIEKANVKMLAALSNERLQRVEAEANAIRLQAVAEGGDDDLSQALKFLEVAKQMKPSEKKAKKGKKKPVLGTVA